MEYNVFANRMHIYLVVKLYCAAIARIIIRRRLVQVEGRWR